MSNIAATPPTLRLDAAMLSAFRILPDGETGQAYSVAIPDNGWAAIARTIRRAYEAGHITTTRGGYAVPDVLDKDEDIIQDFTIPTAEAFAWWQDVLNLEPVDLDVSDECDGGNQ